MPINSFENYHLSWKPDKSKLYKPFYKSLFNTLIEEIINGTLAPNTKLPPQRELADYLDLNLSTITKAYNLCRMYGFVYGKTGKGTFVSANINIKNNIFIKPKNTFELGLVEPLYQFDFLTHEIAKEIINKKQSVELLQYSEPLGSKFQLTMAKKYLLKLHLNIQIDKLAIFSGAQNSFAIILLSLFKTGDMIAVDTYTYSNFRSLANSIGIQLIDIENDGDGMKPSALTKACQRHNIKGLFLMPTCSNPTNIIMSLERRIALSEVIVSNNLILIEDETYAFVLDEIIPPFSSIIPEHTIYVNGLSKALSAGLRIAFVYFPSKYKEKIVSTSQNINLSNVSMNAEIVAKMIESGVADLIISKKKEQAKLRNTIYKAIFGVNKNSQSFFQWLELSDKFSSEQFEILAKKQGLRILGSHHFLVNNDDKNYIRISLTSIIDINELTQALQLLKSLL